ncbi:MAG: hypothetical protein LOD94_00675 [Gammaproteobacteria bacterium]|nr:hypothetical protein [Gammaproteobacteria bacterium]
MSGEMRLVEACEGVGEIDYGGRTFPGVRYDVRRYQGFAPSGLPVPGVHRVEGWLDLASVDDPQALVQAVFTLRLDDGRTMRLTCIDADGRVLAEGHGPSRCGCC